MNKDCFRIIDVNLNRSREGLRVCEEITRFILKKPNFTSQLKNLRHQISTNAKNFSIKPEVLLKARNSRADLGKNLLNKSRRKNYLDLFIANMQRTQESLRVLEEFSKMFSQSLSRTFLHLRFKTYELEKKILAQF
ncbi:MAG: thiamine-phosphate pyrophosphorylase [Candidatus Omnitrophica bacterium]|nr:thiamine-phosphate pyrophosphorylase [Candidatus Omnitrophota bacterium]